MKKNMLIVFLGILVGVIFALVFVNFHKNVENIQQPSEGSVNVDVKIPNLLTEPFAPSIQFMDGYWDGWHGKWLGPIRWVASDEYRQGHMLGTYDKENNIQRYHR